MWTLCYKPRSLLHDSTVLHTRTVARKFSIGGLYSSAGRLDIVKLTKIPLIYLGGLELGLGTKPTTAPRGDGTASYEMHCRSQGRP